MVQRVKLSVPGFGSWTMENDSDLGFSLAGLKKFLETVTVREGYFECLYGTEVKIPLALVLRYVEGAAVEVISE